MLVLILAGGSGSRLWPLSRKNYPKQFLRIGNEASFLQKTVQRNLDFIAPEDLYIITSEAYYDEVRRQIDPRLHSNMILEPAQKNTAPAIAHALSQIETEEVCLITPADHTIAPQSKYREAIEKGEKLAMQGDLVTFAVRPTSPETGYGYLRANGDRVEAFVEKPDLKTAQTYLESGDYFWNSGLFAFTKSSFEREAKKHCPALIAPFHEMPSISLDYAIMEKSDRVALVHLDLTWSDIGSWESIYELLEKDEQKNACHGKVHAIDTQNSLLYAGHRLISTIGMSDVMVVETDDVVLVAPKKEAQRVRELVGELTSLGKKEVHDPLTCIRPWGSYTVLMESNRYKIKKIEVKPREKLSLQKHYHRSEHWVVVKGTAVVTIGEELMTVHEGESIFVPKSAVHRVENPGRVPLEIIEVQVGEYLGEDDIVRFEDIYGRRKEEPANKLF